MCPCPQATALCPSVPCPHCHFLVSPPSSATSWCHLCPVSLPSATSVLCHPGAISVVSLCHTPVSSPSCATCWCHPCVTSWCHLCPRVTSQCPLHPVPRAGAIPMSLPGAICDLVSHFPVPSRLVSPCHVSVPSPSCGLVSLPGAISCSVSQCHILVPFRCHFPVPSLSCVPVSLPGAISCSVSSCHIPVPFPCPLAVTSPCWLSTLSPPVSHSCAIAVSPRPDATSVSPQCPLGAECHIPRPRCHTHVTSPSHVRVP